MTLSRRCVSTLFGLAVLAATAPTALAATDCYYDRFGQYQCRNYLSNGARIGIGIACIILAILAVATGLMLRRRRAQRIANYNNSFIPNQQAYPPQQGGYPSPGYPPHAGPGGGPEMPYPPPAFHPPSGPPPPPMYTPKA